MERNQHWQICLTRLASITKCLISIRILFQCPFRSSTDMRRLQKVRKSSVGWDCSSISRSTWRAAGRSDHGEEEEREKMSRTMNSANDLKLVCISVMISSDSSSVKSKAVTTILRVEAQIDRSYVASSPVPFETYSTWVSALSRRYFKTYLCLL